MSETVVVNVGEETVPENPAAVPDAVELARVEAERDVRVAEIEADTARSAIEAGLASEAIRAENKDGELWTEVTALKSQMAAMQTVLSTLETQVAVMTASLSSTPPVVSEAMAPEVEVVAVPVEPEVTADVADRPAAKTRRVRLL